MFSVTDLTSGNSLRVPAKTNAYISIQYTHKVLLINGSFQAGNFPNELKLAEVTPVYKKKDPLNKENCCPVSLLSYTSKLFEKIVYEQMNSYMGLRFFLIYCPDSVKIIILNTPC